jgi:predicted hotdog family 3-hydroxylacyl-ACP dehydratase
MLMDQTGIARAIPHAGAMCLLEAVLEADASHVVCVTRSHRDPANPLARAGRLRAACGVEYAAQAMAVHGACSGTLLRRPQSGYLASVRELRLHVAFLDEVEGELLVEAQRLLGEGAHVIYRFAVRAGPRILVEGRAAAVLDVGPR